MQSPNRRTEKRRFPRRAKSIRFRFDHQGDQHRAVSTFVSRSGAFLKSSHVPRPGTLLTLVERFNAEGIDLSVRGEVMWTRDEPTLEQPDTGFGFRFIELATRADPSHLEEFLKALDPTAPTPVIAFEERATGAHAVYRFPLAELDPQAYREDEPGFLEIDDPVIVDLDRELDRLSREERNRGPSAPEAAPSPPPLPPAAQGPPPLPNTSAASPDARTESTEASGLRVRSRKRSVTGIFTALFSRGAKVMDDLSVEHAEPTPTISEGTLIHDARRPKLLLSWPQGSVVARIESLGRQGAILWTNDAAPERGQEVKLEPVGTTPSFDLAISARVLTREDRKKSGVSWLSLGFVKVDERGRVGRFQEYLRHINGPGADER